MSVITVDNTLTTQLGAKVKEANSFKKMHGKIHVTPKKRKRDVLTNSSKK